MLTPRQAAQLCAASYDPAAKWDAAFIVRDAAAFVKVIAPDTLALVCPGTHPDRLGEWLRDLDAVPVEDPIYGWVHQGFRRDALEFRDAVRQRCAGMRVLACGHSKGGPDAALTCAFLRASGVMVEQLTTFGCPGFMLDGNGQIANLIGPVPGDYFRAGGDPVPLVPEGFTRPKALVQLGRAPLIPTPFGLLDHPVAHYLALLPPEPMQAAA